MKLSGIAVWAHLQKPKKEGTNPKTGQPIPACYTLCLVLEDMKQAKELKTQGFNVKKIEAGRKGFEDYVGKAYLDIKEYAFYKDGTPAKKPQVFDSQLKPFEGLVGNGSKVTVIFACKSWEGPGGSGGIAAKLRKVQVTELVEYADDLEDFEVVKDGFVASSESGSSSVMEDEFGSSDADDEDVLF